MYDGHRLKELREEQHLTREQLSARIDISTAQIARHEASTIPSGLDTTKYAEFYRVSTDYILGLTTNRRPNVDDSNLTEKEREIISALRQGDARNAILSILQEPSEVEE